MKNAILTGLTRVALRSAVVIAALGAGSLLAQPVVKTMGGGTVTGSFGYRDTNTLFALFHTPMGTAVSQDGQTVFVADRDNNAVRLYTDFASPNNGWTFTFTTNFISKPVGVALDSAGDVYVLNRGTTNAIATNGTVLEFDQYGFFIKTNAYGLTNAAGMLLDPFGNIYVTERSNLLVEIPNSTTNVTTVATVTVVTNVTVGTNIIVGTNVSLQGIALMPGGLIAACDSGRNGIYVITPNFTNPANAIVTAIAGFNGQGDGTGINNEGLPAYRAKFFQPMGVAAAGDGTLIVSDFGNGHVKVITTSGIVTNFYGVVSNDWKTAFPGWVDGQVVVPDQVNGVAGRCPVGVALSADGSTIYTTEDFYHLVRKVTGQSFLAPIQPLPPVPTGLTATLITNQPTPAVLLSWNTTLNTANYVLSRSPSASGFVNIAITGNSSFLDTNVSSGQTYFYVVQSENSGGESADSANASITIPVQPPPAPVIGWFYYNDVNVPIFNVFTNGPNVFQNDILMTILANATGITTKYIQGPTPDTNSVIANGSGAPTFNNNGQPQIQTPLFVTATSNLTVEAVNVNTLANVNSAVVSNVIVFQCGGPFISGENSAQFTLNDVTTNVTYYYTTDGTDPLTNAPASQQISSTNGVPVTLSLNIQTNFTLMVRAIRANYLPSSSVSQFFSTTNFVPNTISWGFQSGEASCAFVGAAGETFYVPVTLTMLPNTPIYSLQFNMVVTNFGAGITNSGPPIAPGAFGFQSMLMKPIPGTSPPIYTNIPPLMLADISTAYVPPSDIVFYNGEDFINLQVTNDTENLLAVGWLERAGATNLYDTLSQNLISFSIARDDIFPNANQPNGVIVGGYEFQIPVNAVNGEQYQIRLGSPSATDDGIGAPGSAVDIFTPNLTNALGPGTLNSIKVVTVGTIPYLVGDVYDFRWFNAGDFGTGNLSAQGSADAEQVFEDAVYGLGIYALGSDFADAMNSSGNFGYLDSDPSSQFYGYYTNGGPMTLAQQGSLFDANAASFSLMDQIAFGHTNGYPYNYPNIADVYVTFTRALDPSRTWYKRLWTNGVLVAEATPNLATALKFTPRTAGGTTPKIPAGAGKSSTLVSITNAPCVNFSSTDYLASAGQTLTIPINASIFGPYPMRMLMLNLSVVPLDGSPALTVPVTFSPNSALAAAFGSTTPVYSDSHGNGNYAAAWLPNSTQMPYQLPGLSNNATIGNLTVTIPANAASSSAYAIHFDVASASPSGLLAFPGKTLTGLITLSNRTNSYYGDGIPDSWRLRYFGTIYNQLSVSNADADGTGMNNYQKYHAGLDPQDPTSVLNEGTDQVMAQSPQDHVVYWPSVSGKTYVIQRSSTLFPAQWTTIATVTGDGTYMEIHDAPAGANYFYRVSTQ
jgi:hypothetical protein